MKKVWIFVVIIILLLGGYLVYSKMDIKDKLNDKKDSSINNNINNEEEVNNLSNDLKDISSNLGLLVIFDAVYNYNDGGRYEPDTGKNLLTTGNKQVFIMEQILKDSKNYDNFIVLSSDGKEVVENAFPTEETTVAYYPYDLFKEEYKKYFNDNFDIDNREKSSFDTKYDKDKNYIYYENKKIGLNGINVTSIDITSVNYDSSSKTYTSLVKINYSDRAKERMNIDSSNGTIKYIRDNNNLYLVSFEINK